MSKIITNEQKDFIERLAAKDEQHFNALIAYGGYMYRQGIIDTTIAICASMALGLVVGVVETCVKERKQKRKEREALEAEN